MNDYQKEAILSEYRSLRSSIDSFYDLAAENRRYARGRPEQASEFLRIANDYERMGRESQARIIEIEKQYPHETDCIKEGRPYKVIKVPAEHKPIISPEEKVKREKEVNERAARIEAESKKARIEAEKKHKAQTVIKMILLGIAIAAIIVLLITIIVFPDKVFSVVLSIVAISLVGAIVSARFYIPNVTRCLWIVFGVSLGILLICTLVNNVGKSYSVEDIAEIASNHSDSHDLYPHEAKYVGKTELKDNEIMLIYTMTGKTKGGNGWEETIYIAEFVKQKKNGEYKKPSRHRIGWEDYPGVYSFLVDYDGYDNDRTILLVVNEDCKTIREDTFEWSEGTPFMVYIYEYPKIINCGKELKQRSYSCFDNDGNKIVKSMY